MGGYSQGNLTFHFGKTVSFLEQAPIVLSIPTIKHPYLDRWKEDMEDSRRHKVILVQGTVQDAEFPNSDTMPKHCYMQC